MNARIFKKNFATVVISLSISLCEAETYYLIKADGSSGTALTDSQRWKSSAGNVCPEFLSSDDFVVNGKRINFRPAGLLNGYFSGGSLSIGKSSEAGSARLFLKNSFIGFGDYEKVEHGGLLLQKGILDIGNVGAAIYSGTIGGRVEIMALESDPFKIRCPISYPYNLEFAAELVGAENSAFEFGSSLPHDVSGIGSAGDSINNITLTLSGDCETFMGTLTMTGSVERAVLSSSGVPEEFASMLILSNTVFSGKVVLNGGTILSSYDASNVCSVATLELRPNSVIMLHGSVERDSEFGLPESLTNSFLSVMQSCSVQGPIYLALPGCDALPNGTTNRIAMLSFPAGTNIDPSEFILCGGTLPPVPYRLVVDVGEDSRETLVCEIEPYAVLLESDSAQVDYSAVVPSALTNANVWSDGKAPHFGVNYIVQRHPSLPDSLMSLQTPTDCKKNSKYEYTFPGRRLIIGTGCRLISRCGTFRSSDLSLQFLNGSYLCFSTFQNTSFIGGVDIDEGVVGIQPYGGNRMTVDRLSGIGTVATGTIFIQSIDSIGGYYSFADTSNFKGKIRLRTSKAQAVDLSLNRCQHLYVSNNSLGSALESFVPDALLIENSSVLSVDAACPTQILANTVNRGVMVKGEGRVCLENSGDVLRIDWPITYNGILLKEGAGTLVLGGSALFGDISADVPAEDGKNDIMLTGGTLAVASSGAVDGCRIVVSNETKLVVSYSSDNLDLLAQGLRNVKTTTPFVLEGTDSLPLIADFSQWNGLPPNGLTVGLITVANDAAILESVRSMLPSRIKIKNFGPGVSVKATLDEVVDAEAQLVTFRLKISYVGTAIIVR